MKLSLQQWQRLLLHASFCLLLGKFTPEGHLNPISKLCCTMSQWHLQPQDYLTQQANYSRIFQRNSTTQSQVLLLTCQYQTQVWKQHGCLPERVERIRTSEGAWASQRDLQRESFEELCQKEKKNMLPLILNINKKSNISGPNMNQIHLTFCLYLRLGSSISMWY